MYALNIHIQMENENYLRLPIMIGEKQKGKSFAPSKKGFGLVLKVRVTGFCLVLIRHL